MVVHTLVKNGRIDITDRWLESHSRQIAGQMNEQSNQIIHLNYKK